MYALLVRPNGPISSRTRPTLVSYSLIASRIAADAPPFVSNPDLNICLRFPFSSLPASIEYPHVIEPEGSFRLNTHPLICCSSCLRSLLIRLCSLLPFPCPP